MQSKTWYYEKWVVCQASFPLRWSVNGANFWAQNRPNIYNQLWTYFNCYFQRCKHLSAIKSYRSSKTFEEYTKIVSMQRTNHDGITTKNAQSFIQLLCIFCCNSIMISSLHTDNLPVLLKCLGRSVWLNGANLFAPLKIAIKVENFLKVSLDSIPPPLPSVKIQIMGGWESLL